MARRAKMTGCGKFIIFLLLAAPLAYIGASYYNGQNGLQNIKNLLGLGEGTSTNSQTISLSDSEWQEQLDEKDEKIRDLSEENSDLKQRIKVLEERVSELEGSESEGDD